MKTLGRREFLKLGATAAGVAPSSTAFSGCALRSLRAAPVSTRPQPRLRTAEAWPRSAGASSRRAETKTSRPAPSGSQSPPTRGRPSGLASRAPRLRRPHRRVGLRGRGVCRPPVGVPTSRREDRAARARARVDAGNVSGPARTVPGLQPGADVSQPGSGAEPPRDLRPVQPGGRERRRGQWTRRRVTDQLRRRHRGGGRRVREGRVAGRAKVEGSTEAVLRQGQADAGSAHDAQGSLPAEAQEPSRDRGLLEAQGCVERRGVSRALAITFESRRNAQGMLQQGRQCGDCSTGTMSEPRTRST